MLKAIGILNIEEIKSEQPLNLREFMLVAKLMLESNPQEKNISEPFFFFLTVYEVEGRRMGCSVMMSSYSQNSALHFSGMQCIT